MIKQLSIAALMAMISFQVSAETRFTIRVPTGNGNSDAIVNSQNTGVAGDIAFAKFTQLEQDVARDVRNALLAVNRVRRVNFVNVDASDFTATVTGLSNGRAALKIEGLDLDARVRANGPVPVICSSVDVDVSVRDIEIIGEYSFGSTVEGSLSNLTVDYPEPDVDADCTGVGGIIGNIFSVFFSEEDIVRGIIADEIEDIQALAIGQSLPGLMDLFMVPAIDNSIAAVESRSGFDIGNFLGNFLDNVITGLNLKIQMLRNNRGPNRNDIIISGFQTTPRVTFIASGTVNTIRPLGSITIDSPGAGEFSVYLDNTLIGTYSGTSTILNETFYPNQRLTVVAENNIFGVPSFAAKHRIVRGSCSGGGRCGWRQD